MAAQAAVGEKDADGEAASAAIMEPAARAREAIARNLRQARAAAGLSLRGLAESAGVSPALLSQLENAQANPTVEVLVGVCTALGTSLAELAREPVSQPVVQRAAERGSADDLEGRTLLSTRTTAQVEVYEMLLPAGDVHQSAPHGAGSEEIAYVVSGKVDVTTDEWTRRLHRGDAIRFDASVEHAYRAGRHDVRIVTAVAMG